MQTAGRTQAGEREVGGRWEAGGRQARFLLITTMILMYIASATTVPDGYKHNQQDRHNIRSPPNRSNCHIPSPTAPSPLQTIPSPPQLSHPCSNCPIPTPNYPILTPTVPSLLQLFHPRADCLIGLCSGRSVRRANTFNDLISSGDKRLILNLMSIGVDLIAPIFAGQLNFICPTES